MQYLDSFTLASAKEEDAFLLSYPYQLEMQCYSHQNVYPFKLFPQKQIGRLTFAPITIFYGGNGSGKSTLLNLIAEKLSLSRSAPFNHTPFYTDYLRFCRYTVTHGKPVPRGSRLISSDDVFDYMLDLRAINDGIAGRREALFAEYERMTDPTAPAFQMRSLDDYDELKRHNDARRKTKSAYVTPRLGAPERPAQSNGESAFAFFTHQIVGNALYLLDEPENSLSAVRQAELAAFLADSARFFGCQFIISTHSPFLLSMHEAKIYDLDTSPVIERRWTELENVRAYRELFVRHEKAFAEVKTD